MSISANRMWQKKWRGCEEAEERCKDGRRRYETIYESSNGRQRPTVSKIFILACETSNDVVVPTTHCGHRTSETTRQNATSSAHHDRVSGKTTDNLNHPSSSTPHVSRNMPEFLLRVGLTPALQNNLRYKVQFSSVVIRDFSVEFVP